MNQDRMVIPQQKRLGTGYRRLGTSTRMRTTQQGGNQLKAKVRNLHKAKVQVEMRPVTQHGLTGMDFKRKAKERENKDYNYYYNTIKLKIKQLTIEIKNMQLEISKSEKNNNKYYSLDKKLNTLSTEVRELEGQLADYNLAFDKQRAGTKPDDIMNLWAHIKQHNENQRQDLDELFMERKQQEEDMANIEEELQEMEMMAENKLNELDPESRQEYESLKNANKLLVQDIHDQRGQINEVNQKLADAENMLQLDKGKLRAKDLRDEIDKLHRKKTDLEAQIEEAKLPPAEARKRLLKRVKADNNEIKELDKRIMKLRKLTDNYGKDLKEMTVDKANKDGEDAQKKKYEILFKKDKEMTTYIDQFEENRKRELEEIASFETQICDVLQGASKSLMMMNQLAGKDEFKELKADAKFKGQQAQNAEKTLEMLQIEYQKKIEEVANLENLEGAIAKQLEDLSNRQQRMQDEINNKFVKIGDIELNAKNEKKQLQRDKRQLETYQQDLTVQLKEVEYKYQTALNKIKMNKLYNEMTKAEKKVANNGKSIYNFKSYIQGKRKDMNYQQIQEECGELLEQLNQVLITKSKL